MTTALYVFVLVIAVDVAGLLLDLTLDWLGLTTITYLAQLYTWPGVLILAWQLLGTVALGWHFFGGEPYGCPFP